MIAAFAKRLRVLRHLAVRCTPRQITTRSADRDRPGSLAEAALVAAGFRNKAAEYRLTRTDRCRSKCWCHAARIFSCCRAPSTNIALPCRQSAPSGSAAPATAPCLAGAARSCGCAARPYCRTRSSVWRRHGTKLEAPRDEMMPARAGAEIATPFLLGVLGAATVVAFLSRWRWGRRGSGSARLANGGECRLAHLLGVVCASAWVRSWVGVGALRGGAAGLPAQSAGRAEPGWGFGWRGPGGGAGDPSWIRRPLALALPVGGLAGAAVAMLAVGCPCTVRVDGPVTLILAGLAVSGIATALIRCPHLSRNRSPPSRWCSG